jgi:hypothetical protein
MSLRPKTLSNHEEAELVRSFHNLYLTKKFKSHAQMWFEVVMQFLSWKFEGAEVITRSVRDAEEKILQNPIHCKEYFAALYSVLDLGRLGDLSEEQKALYLMMASSDERETAIKLIQS